jgi:tetratricopeptide (TPR) repeat protein
MKLPAWRVCVAAVAVALMSSIALGQTARELWESLDRQGDQPRTRHEESLALNRQALALAEQQSSADLGSAQWQHAVWRSCAKVGALLAELGKPEEALAVFNQGLEKALQLARAEPERGEWQRAIAMFWLAIGDALVELKHPQDALQAFREGLSVSERLAVARSSPPGTRRSVMTAQGKIGGVLWEQGDFAGALKIYQAAREIAKNRAVAGDQISQDDLATADQAVGTTLVALGSFGEAVDFLQENLAIRERLVAEKPDASRTYDLSVAQELVGKALLGLGNLDKSLSAFEASLTARQAAIAAEPANPAWEIATANSYGNVATVLAQLGRRPEARDSLQKGRALLARRGADTAWFDSELSRLE